jgi:hypothetical protein
MIPLISLIKGGLYVGRLVGAGTFLEYAWGNVTKLRYACWSWILQLLSILVQNLTMQTENKVREQFI